jgi:hypothetical protein
LPPAYAGGLPGWVSILRNPFSLQATIKVYAPEILSDLLELCELGAQPLDLMLDGGPTGLPNLTQWILVSAMSKTTRGKNNGGIFLYFYDFIQHRFICRPSDSNVSKDARIEPSTVANLALTVRHFNHLHPGKQKLFL